MEYLYETPWWLPTGLVLVGVVLLYSTRMYSAPGKTGRWMRGTGLGLLLAAGGLCGLSYWLQSDRERVVERTGQLVIATGARNWPAMESLLHPQIAVGPWRGREQIVGLARAGIESARVSSAGINGPPIVRREGEEYFTQVSVGARFEDGSSASSWELEWVKTAQGWQAIHIRPLDSPGVSASTMEEFLRSARR